MSQPSTPTIVGSIVEQRTQTSPSAWRIVAARPVKEAPQHRPTTPSRRSTTPFRDVFAIRLTAETRDGRLRSLTRDFSEKAYVPLKHQLDSIAVKARKCRFLSTDDRGMLRRIIERCSSFMANAEAVLQEAVSAESHMDRAAVQRCHELWNKANDMCTVAQDILLTIDASQSTDRRGTPHRTGRGVLCIPLPSLSAITTPTATRSTTSHVTTQSIKAQRPPLAAALERKTLITAGEASDAQHAFIRLHGPREGNRQFLLWLASLPVDTLRALESQISVTADGDDSMQ